MFYRVLNETGAVVQQLDTLNLPAGSAGIPLTEERAVQCAEKLAQGQPGRKYYVAKAIKEVIVSLPAAIVTDIK